MDATGDSECGGSLPLPSASPGAFLNSESSVTSVTDLLGLPDLDLFDFESKDMSSQWLSDVFSSTDRLPADLIPQLTGEKSIPEKSGATSPEPQSCQNPQGLCISLATGLLKSMHANSPSCLLGMGSRDQQPQVSRAVDAVLSANQEALKTMRGLLGCSCSVNPQLQLLITTICAETIAWYWRIIHTYSRHRNADMDNGILLTDRVKTLKRSFSIGDYCLEGPLETTLIVQVLSSRLQELDDFIGGIVWNVEQSAAINKETRGCPMQSVVHIRMNTFLNTHLSAVRRDLLSLQEYTLVGEATSGGSQLN
ncbi:hypothetical protein F4818DRAFT_453534 [Hypoxylon cercidicola]|nr:hypothetical protein F4818DRAFT_453534 [Hypoxylon cercidicola]